MFDSTVNIPGTGVADAMLDRNRNIFIVEIWSRSITSIEFKTGPTIAQFNDFRFLIPT
jgi:hypothetical protein